ncbi:MAG: NAD(P)-binding protein [Rhizobiales bacterium]|nr:NAD(P)-binding protein [Hyphomicrobiales bacterium]
MSCKGAFDVLFEPVVIGPVTAKNRFYAVPQCTGMGFSYPNAYIRHREIKAEGGWGVVCTEECMIHPTSDHSASTHLRLWTEDDVRFLARVADGVHRHGALLGVELAHAGRSAANRLTREYPIAPSPLHYFGPGPFMARVMDKTDIRALRGWHRDAALRARRAGADIIYVYCAHDLSIAMQFLLERTNSRTDEYGGSLENRVRLLRELLEDTKDAVGDACAVAIRFCVEEMLGPEGLSSEGECADIIGMLAEIPDLWDVNVSDWNNDSGPSRFFEEGYQERYTGFVKSLTSKPVVGVGRYTSPDRMVAAIKAGRLDLIGAARPSIADPFLPAKIEEGRLDEIRECIGCNMCTVNQHYAVPIRCTQNPSIGVEWSRDWHPERVSVRKSEKPVLVVGSGPAGLECALTLARRGYPVTLAEARPEAGGRVARERKLPGLTAWGRVADHRLLMLGKMANVDVFFESDLTATHLLEFGFSRIALALGAHWRRDGVGRRNARAIKGAEGANVYTPDDVMNGIDIPGPVVVFDDDHYYMGSVIAEKLALEGKQVHLVTPAAEAATWSRMTLEWPHVQARLAELAIPVLPFRNLVEIHPSAAVTVTAFTSIREAVECASVVLVTGMASDQRLLHALLDDPVQLERAGIELVEPIGDYQAPSSIAQAVHDGRRFAMQIDEVRLEVPYKVEPLRLCDEPSSLAPVRNR